MDHITTQVCPDCYSDGFVIHCGMRFDCHTCDGTGVIVQAYGASDLMFERIELSEHEIRTYVYGHDE